MTLEALASDELPAFLVYDTISVPPLRNSDPSTPSFLFHSVGKREDGVSSLGLACSSPGKLEGIGSPDSTTAPVQRKRRRRTRTCKNEKTAETQRMTHIAVERNRRRQMNEHLSMLRSLMPDSYIQRGDQASIVGGAIDFVKELEQLLQSLEVQMRTLQQQQSGNGDDANLPPFAQFFTYPQYFWRHHPPPSESRPAVADIEVTLIETHANLRILSPCRPQQLFKMVAGLQSLRLTILHLNVTTLDSMVLYSLSAKVEEGCNLTTVEDIAAAVHHILSLIKAEAASTLSQ